MWHWGQRSLLHIKVNAPLTAQATGVLLEKLNSAGGRKEHDALALSISACAGDHYQVRKVVDAIDYLSKEKLLPVYTFAEDYALDSGCLLLMAGKEAYANPFSIIGDVGKSYKTYYIGRLLESIGVGIKRFGDSHQYPYTTFEELTKENRDLHTRITTNQKAELVAAVLKRRQHALKAKNITPEQQEFIFSGKAFTAHQAVQLGLVDKIATFEEFRREKFKDTIVKEDFMMTAKVPRWFRFMELSNDKGSLEGLLSGILAMDTAELAQIDMKELLAKALSDVSPDKIRTVIDELATTLAETSIQKSLAC